MDKDTKMTINQKDFEKTTTLVNSLIDELENDDADLPAVFSAALSTIMIRLILDAPNAEVAKDLIQQSLERGARLACIMEQQFKETKH